jgi:signal transduction histidine kinase
MVPAFQSPVVDPESEATRVMEELLSSVGFDDDDVRELASLRGTIVPQLVAIWCEVAADLTSDSIVGAMNQLRTTATERILSGTQGTPVASLRALNKLLDVELGAMLSHAHRSSERKAALREHRAASDQLAAMTTLSSGLAHELRNPLNAAKLQLDVLRRRLSRMAAAAELTGPMDLAYGELSRLSAMVNDFLAFAKPTPLHAVEQDLVAVMRQVVELELPLAQSRGIELRLEMTRGAIELRFDAPKLEQAIRNLVRNALEAAPSGGHVVVRIADESASIHVRVTDDGPGIPAEICARMYEPFFSTKPSGTGLGMSIAKTSIAILGGTIDVESSPAGTTFDVALPRLS